jgi:serine protease Do
MGQQGGLKGANIMTRTTQQPMSEIAEHTVSSSPSLASIDRLPVVIWLRRQCARLWRSTPPTVLFVGGGVILAAVVSFGAGWLGADLGRGDQLNAVSLGSQKQIVTSESQLINAIAKTVGPSVVSVNVTSTSQNTQGVFGYGLPQSEQSAGTGIIITSAGLIITNRHVVPDGATIVSVTLADGTEIKDVSVIGRTNSSSSLDVAFLKINDAQGKTLVPAAIGDSSKVQVGDAVVAIGNALGQFQNTVTSGIVSGYGRSVQASSQGSGQSVENLDDLFQTDAAINEGNSGGPLVNLNGQVIGINTAIAGNAQNIGFAIPVNDVKGLIEQVEASGKLQQPWLGVYYIPLTNDIAQQYGLDIMGGAWVPSATIIGKSPIVTGGPADSAGIKQGDVIIAIDGVAISQTHSLTSVISRDRVGQTIAITVIRSSKTLMLHAILANTPSSTVPSATTQGQ